MLAVGTAFAFFQSITPGTNAVITDWRYIHLMPVAHYWFVESLFLIFMVLIPLEHFRVLDSETGLAIVFFIASLLFVFNVGTPWLSIAGAAYLFPYFLIGLYCSRFPIDFQFKRAAGTTFLLMVILFLVFYGLQYAGGRRSFIALLIGTISCVSLLYIRFESVLLSSIGFYSYPIYLLHVFFTAASRIVFKSAGVTNIWILFILGTVIGLAGPIIVELFASKFPLSRILLPGKSPFKKGVMPEAVTT
jgi:hypothetical protein